MIVTDASVLIALSKIGKLHLLKLVYKMVVIGPMVKEEVIDRGKAINALEVRHIEAGLREKWIRVVQLTGRERALMQRLTEKNRLGEGESESLALASIRSLMVMLDDKEARLMAEDLKVEYIGTAGILLAAFSRNRLTYVELETTIRDLGKVIWLAPDVVAEIFKMAREMKK